MMSAFFSKFSKSIATWLGHPISFIVALLVVIIWLLSGPVFHYSNTWQLVINTGTTVITFLMVFVIQNTQNRDSIAMHIKLDELIRVTQAHNVLVGLEEVTPEELLKIKADYAKVAEHAREKIKKGIKDTDSPLVNHDCLLAEEEAVKDVARQKQKGRGQAIRKSTEKNGKSSHTRQKS
jgi:low affinity Fe/Cu permease